MRFVALFIALTITAQAASIWPNGNRLQTFQNGFLLGNGATLDATGTGFNFSSGLQTPGPVTQQQQATPSNPSSGFNRLYFKSDNNLYKLDSSGQETNVSSVAIGGQQQSTAEFTSQRFPNQQAVRSNPNEVFVDTDNGNLLLNGEFDAELSGLKAYRVVTASQTNNVFQDTTLYASQVGGLQGLAFAWIRNTTAGSRVCPRVNGARQNNLCVNLATDDRWTAYEIPFVLGTASSGIEIDTPSSTGTLIADKAYVGLIKPGMITETGAVGPWFNYGPITITATTTNPTKATTRQQDSVRCRVSGSDYECQYKLAQASGAGGANGSGGYIFSLPAGITFDSSVPLYSNQAFTGVLTAAQAADQTLNSAVVGYANTSTDLVASSLGLGKVVATSASTFQVYVLNNLTDLRLASSGSYPLASNNLAYDFTLKFRGAGLNSRVSLYSQQCRKPSDCENVFSAKVSAAGVVSDENLDWISGNCTGSSPYTCTFNSSIFTVAPNCTITNVTDGGGYFSAGSPSSSAFTYRSILTTSGATTSIGFNVTCVKQGADYKERNMITGSFEGIEKCADPYECTDTFSAKIGITGAVTTENIDFINGSCTNATPLVCTFNAGVFTNAPACVVTADNAGGSQSFSVVHTSSASSVSFQLFTDTGGINTTSLPKAIICQKQGVDFRPKTAVAGTFIDSVVSPGAGKPGLCSAKISSTGVISDQIGGCFASCTNANPRVCTYTTNYWGAGSSPNCVANQFNNGASGEATIWASSNTTASVYTSNSSGANSQQNFNISCHGVRQ